MTTAVSTLLGRPVWYELMTTDMAAAETFYRKVVGWTSAPFERRAESLRDLQPQRSGPCGGRDEEARRHEHAAVLGDVCGRAEARGGRGSHQAARRSELSPVIEVPTVGRLQMMKDPHGAAFYIIQPASTEEKPEKAPEIGEASWHELMTTDAPAAMKFYSEIFGWRPSETMDMGAMGKPHVQPASRNDRRHDEQAARDGACAVTLEDLFPRARHQRGRRAHQGERRQVLNGPMEVPGGDWIVNARIRRAPRFHCTQKARA